jgi:vacuolar-type H+-ATPase subunit I/STV1
MNPTITKIFQSLTLASFGMAVANFKRSKSAEQYTKQIENLNKELPKVREEKDKLAETYQEHLNDANTKIMESIEQQIKGLENNLTKFINKNQGTKFNSEDNFEEGIARLSVEAKNVTKATTEAFDEVSKQSILDLEGITNSLNEFYSHLGLAELLAAINLSGCVVVFLSMMSMIIVLYSETLITKFKIVERFPRLKNIIELRRKFQNYYLIWEICVILGVVIIMAYCNFLFIFT